MELRAVDGGARQQIVFDGDIPLDIIEQWYLLVHYRFGRHHIECFARTDSGTGATSGAIFRIYLYAVTVGSEFVTAMCRHGYKAVGRFCRFFQGSIPYIAHISVQSIEV